jgi:hypothetical protein
MSPVLKLSDRLTLGAIFNGTVNLDRHKADSDSLQSSAYKTGINQSMSKLVWGSHSIK